MTQEAAVAAILEHAATGQTPLGVLSANLDHVNHFGSGGRWEGCLDLAPVNWLTLLDGAPLVAKAEGLTGRSWPRLAGSDLIDVLFDGADRNGLSVGFLGGSVEAQQMAHERFRRDRPALRIAGWWTPQRQDLTDRAECTQLIADIRASGVDILVVCLGKPRQELWISEYGALTGAKVLLAFGAVVDFLAGNIRRAPVRVANAGLEWAWRLALEPRRLAKRYLVDGPEAYLKLQRFSGGTAATSALPATGSVAGSEPRSTAAPGSRTVPRDGFTPVTEHADVAVLVVTYNSASDICGLLDSLCPETGEQSIKVVVADNSPDPLTLTIAARYAGVDAFATGGNIGYAAGINAAMARAGTADTYLVLNPDLQVMRGAIGVLRASMARTGAGVVVPVLRDPDGTVYPSLRREPSILRAMGDALCGSRFPGRPGWLSEMDFDAEGYVHAHRVDWATGAALLIRSDVAASVGPWDESYFLYSEETDYLHRVREIGCTVWFEPKAAMLHSRGGSGRSAALDALMMANKVRYASKHHDAGYAMAFHLMVVLSALLRMGLPGRRGTLGLVARKKRWDALPHAASYSSLQREDIPAGAVIIPAHNEASVLGRALEALTLPRESGNVEIIVACNGCTDGTAAIAQAVPGVRVIDVAEASKPAALNAGDEVATLWPRMYVDADVEVPVEALRATFEALSGGGVLCARPRFTYDTAGASWSVRAYYRARNRLPQASASMWGAGVYGLNRDGHQRLGRFPELAAEDCYLDGLFTDSEKAVLECPPVTVRTPRTGRALLTVLKRTYRSNSELPHPQSGHTAQTLQELAASIKSPSSAVDGSVYAVFALLGRLLPSSHGSWERDESSRT
ncbi:polymer biosynthesis protein, WecB/TagA/CpsF family [Pseudarthrobacter equi]|uniref:Polymer biosynthesis protein, WecB/TagA/CpsF family n=1 Tax=Pseudarthrobacter equi TaxID=728066 RepID=A0A1H1SXP3_9MICC|nr:WecB/TagA/CpsF family glycosyltransferase [Pseudarthrobacter equi]SDS52807.1 polymer biosynthesis protein, WecB/TagA/CpsF family [Pseudarthrobacter equi]